MFAPRYFGPSYFGPSYFGVGAAAQAIIIASDRYVYAKLRDLITATREFDFVYVGREAPEIPAKFAAYLVLTPEGNPRSVMDGSPSMRASTARYQIQIGVRCTSPKDDERAYQKADRLKNVVLNSLLHPEQRSYGDLCKPWLSSLVPTGDPVKAGGEWKATLIGSFTYLVNLKTGYSLELTRW